MTKFDISSNDIRAEGGKTLAAGLQGNQVITELNISSNNLGYNSGDNGDTSGVIAIANAIPDMGALTSLNMSANGLKGAEAGEALGDAIAANTVLKELDISGGEYDSEKCDVEFVQTFAVGLRDNRALSSLNLQCNKLTRGALMPNPQNYNDWGTEDSNYESDTKGVKAVANAIKEMRTLTSLNISANNLEARGAKIVAKAIKVTNC
jgi:Ran GTPase-activating protein (RanGAP) involved in mRNA processing and transport